MPKNESIRGAIQQICYSKTGEYLGISMDINNFELRVDSALAEIKRILKEKISAMKWTYAHDSACSCASCANAVYRNVMLYRVIEMVEGLK